LKKRNERGTRFAFTCRKPRPQKVEDGKKKREMDVEMAEAC